VCSSDLVIVQDWKNVDFDLSSSNKDSSQSTPNDDLQYAYIKERQKAYDELKRNSAKHEQARQNAIRTARNTLNEKRVKKMYEEAFKASQASDAFRHYTDNHQSHTNADSQVDDFIHQYQPQGATYNYSESYNEDISIDSATDSHPHSYPIKGAALKAVFQALGYLVFFALGIFGTLYWQSVYEPLTDSPKKEVVYVPGIYPQFRQGLNYTVKQANLYLAPDTESKGQIVVPEGVDVIASQLTSSDWVAIRYQDRAGWIQGKNLGFGSVEHAQKTGCYGHPGQAPDHGEVFGQHKGTSRLRILNPLTTQSLLTFESYDGFPTFSIFLHVGQPFAANFIPRGQYRLVLQTGSLYHRACNQFLFNKTSKVVIEGVQFSSAEQSLTLTQ